MLLYIDVVEAKEKNLGVKASSKFLGLANRNKQYIVESFLNLKEVGQNLQVTLTSWENPYYLVLMDENEKTPKFVKLRNICKAVG